MVEEKLLCVVDTLGRENIVAVVSDNGGGMPLARRLLTEEAGCKHIIDVR